VKTLVNKVKDPGFSSKLVITTKIRVLSYELKRPTSDNKLSSAEQNKEGKKYAKSLKLPEVRCKFVK
jgi:hypothetical protein